ncbi:hypothetical protein EYF80_046379 [Liparis tanakae]|uniref:Uncharacterized protein n=1 Tax=Liparis tanakae TaxID=230148 RepID=A0A4Z2FRG6_9TELE|nr:hypothetical protein EYF80_046379 [Liparis tanakae]
MPDPDRLQQQPFGEQRETRDEEDAEKEAGHWEGGQAYRPEAGFRKQGQGPRTSFRQPGPMDPLRRELTNT